MVQLYRPDLPRPRRTGYFRTLVSFASLETRHQALFCPLRPNIVKEIRYLVERLGNKYSLGAQTLL